MSNKLTARAIMEILGSPKDHVENTTKILLDKIKERKNIELLKFHIADVKEANLPDNKTDVKFYSSFIEAEIKLDDIEKLIEFCFDFMPSSIDILEPSTLDVDARHLNSVINDLMARLHRYDMFLKNLKAHSLMMKQELDKLKEKKK